MRADRLLSILLLLKRRGLVRSSELAEELEVSRRTILRDMEALSIAGIPVYSIKGVNGGWRLVDGYEEVIESVDKEALLGLFLMKQSPVLKELGIGDEVGDVYREVRLLKGYSSAGDLYEDRVLIDGVGWFDREEDLQFLPDIQRGVFKSRAMCVLYGNDREKRVVKPLGLVAKHRTWYLVALHEDVVKTFRVSRFRSVELVDVFERDENFRLSEFWEEWKRAFKRNLPEYRTELRVSDASVVERLKARAFVQSVCEKENFSESGVVEASFDTFHVAMEIILSFGGEIEVVEPETLRMEMKHRLEWMLRVYE